jgi:hypothetical protein
VEVRSAPASVRGTLPVMDTRRASLGWTSIALVGLAGCAPTPEEAGRAVLFAAPWVFIVGLGLLRLLLWLWRKAEPDLVWRDVPAIVTVAVLLVGAALSLVGVPVEQPPQPDYGVYNNGVPGVLEWVDEAAYIFGPSLLVAVLVTWRVWHAISRRTAFSWAFVPAAALAIAPAVPLTLDLIPDRWFEFTISVWWFSGLYGIVPGVLLVAFVVEALIRIKRARRA